MAELGLLAAAIGCGTLLRFLGLSTREMSADEAASWASAVAPRAADVVKLQAQLNPGKLPLHDLVLHGWIALFGSGLFAMRALSALCGVLAIVLVYLVAKELLQRALGPNGGALENREVLAPVTAALLYAISLIAIKYSREARMYPLMLVAELLQVTLFIRVTRAPARLAWVGLALLTALSLAANFTAAFLLGAEAIYLVLVFCRQRARAPAALYAALSLAAGVLGFLPLALRAFVGAIGATHAGVLQWIETPPLWEPVALFNKATGTFAFPVVALAAVLGALKAGRVQRDEVQFLLLWMWVPVLLMFGFSLLITPVFVERFVLISFVPFFILAAMGITAIESPVSALTAALLCVALTLGHVYSYGLKPHDAQWREATAVALSSAPPAGAIAVAPGYAVNVVRYYGAESPGARGVPGLRLVPAPAENLTGAAGAESDVLILGGQGVAASERARLSAAFPRMLSRHRGDEVRAAR